MTHQADSPSTLSLTCVVLPAACLALQVLFITISVVSSDLPPANAPLFLKRYPVLFDPLQLDISLQEDLPPIKTTRPLYLPPGSLPSPGDAQPMVPVAHRRIQVLSTYWHQGYKNASPGAFLRREATERLYVAAESLFEPWGLAVFDAYRPLALQREIYDFFRTSPGFSDDFVHPPSLDPSTPPAHLTGGALDLTLTHDGIPLSLGTGFDSFTPESATAFYEDTPGLVRLLRRLLFHTMSNAGFASVESEWWHFEYGTRLWAALGKKAPLYSPADVVVSDSSLFTNSFRVIHVR